MVILNDSKGNELKLGDVVQSEYGYKLVVSFDQEIGYYGKLICHSKDSCADIPYSLTGGKLTKVM